MECGSIMVKNENINIYKINKNTILRTRLSVTQDLITAVNAQVYLEIGVEEGIMFYRAKAPKKIAVDPKFLFSGRSRLRKNRLVNTLFYGNHEYFFEETSNDFFSHHKQLFDKNKVDVALIDGLHTYAQVYLDIMNVLEVLSPNGVMIIDDCNPPSAVVETPVINSITEVWEKAKRGELPGWNDRWTGDVWKALVRLQSERDDLNIFTLDIDFGMAVIVKGQNRNKLDFSKEQINNFTYSDLEKNRIKWLNLKSADYLDEVLPLLNKVK